MQDPYTYKNGVLINKLGIEDYDELNKAEASIGFVKLIDIDSIKPSNFNEKSITQIHKHIFEDIFDWAGEFRTVPLFKEELVLGGISVPYSDPSKIERDIIVHLNDLNSVIWQNLNIDEKAFTFAREISLLWRIHPFRDGNTRTILSFAYIYAKEHGFPFDIETFTNMLSRKYDENGKITSFSVRDHFVLACLDEAPEVEHLAYLFKKAIANKEEKSLQKK